METTVTKSTRRANSVKPTNFIEQNEEITSQNIQDENNEISRRYRTKSSKNM